MALLPYHLRPRVIIRRKALWGGVFGPSTFWKVVAIWVFGQGTIKKFFGKQPEPLGTYSVGRNAFVNVISVQPMSRKERKRRGITKAMIVAAARADVGAARPDAKIVVK